MFRFFIIHSSFVFQKLYAVFFHEPIKIIKVLEIFFVFFFAVRMVCDIHSLEVISRIQCWKQFSVLDFAQHTCEVLKSGREYKKKTFLCDTQNACFEHRGAEINAFWGEYKSIVC